MARIVFAPLGTLGDLHPSIAVALACAARGHRAAVASHPGYRARVEAAGIEFHPVRPDLHDPADLHDVMTLAMDETTGSDYVVRQLVLPSLRDAYEDLMRALPGADAVVSHSLGFAAAVAAEKLGIARYSQVLQPLSLFSAYDPPVTPAMPMPQLTRRLGPAVWRVLWRLGRRQSRAWFREVDALRAEAGLPASDAHPLFDAFSRELNLASFPAALASPQPDWPPHTVLTGFCLYDRDELGAGLSHELRRFLDGGPPPIVFTLGSSGVWIGASFYRAAAEAAHALGRRAVLLVGPEPRELPAALPDGVIAVDYAAHSELFPRTAAIVHHGGIGTTAQALRAGRPMVVVPLSHDQPDNAARCVRLGVARVVPRRQVSAARLAAALRVVLDDPAIAARAATIGEQTRAERGAEAATDAIEAALEQRDASAVAAGR